MSKESDWLEQFTGMKVAGGPLPGAEDPLAQARDYEAKMQRKQALLLGARRELATVKASFQAAMATEIKIKGEFFKQKMLEVKGTQTDEAEFEDIQFGKIKLEPQTQIAISQGQLTITKAFGRLREAQWPDEGPQSDLFTEPELRDEFWTPLKRERILPETYIAGMYSETQQMLDATNEAYEDAVADKKAKGLLTPKVNMVSVSLDAGAELLAVGGTIAGGFGPDQASAALAKNILNGASKALAGSAAVYDKVLAKEYTDASSLALDTIRGITTTALGVAGISKDTIGAVDKGFKAGDAAVKAGRALARGADGAGDAAGFIAAVLEGALGAAVATTSGTDKENLERALALAPAVFRQGKIISVLRQKVMDRDAEGVFMCFVESANNGLEAARGMELVDAKARSHSTKESEKITELFTKDTEKLKSIIAAGGAGAAKAIQFAVLASKGRHLEAFNTLVDAIGSGLSLALQEGGVPKDQAEQIAGLYAAAASAPKALDALLSDKPDIAGAITHLAGGVEKAFGAVAGDDPALKTAGKAITTSLIATAAGVQTAKLYREGKVDEGIDAFVKGVSAGLAGALSVADVAQGGGQPDPAAAAALEQLKAASAKLAENKDAVAAGLQKAVKEIQAAERAEEVRIILEEAKDDLDKMKQARDAGAAASTIDALIAKMERDRMVMKLAQQIVEGGTAFLARFVPGLGAVGAAATLAAQMLAAAERAQQLSKWIAAQGDLEAAQSPLSSSAQNFVANQAEQFTHYAVQSAFTAARLIGEVVKLSGQASAAGFAIDAAATAGASVENIIYKFKRKADLEAAWKVTAKALRNPTNRKLGLRARALNPTLAKYSMAWGAVTLKDPLARNAMRASGLTEAHLNNESAGVDKVVGYLEKFYEDDQQLYREVETNAKWVPKDLTLDVAGWVTLLEAATKSIGLDRSNTGKIEGLIASVEQLLEGPQPDDKDYIGRRALIDRKAKLLPELELALAAYKPVAKTPEGAKQMTAAVGLLVHQAKGAQRALESERIGVEVDEALAKAEAQAKEKEQGKAKTTAKEKATA